MGCTVSGLPRHPSLLRSTSKIVQAPISNTTVEIELKSLPPPRLTCLSESTLIGSPQPSRPTSACFPSPPELIQQHHQITTHIRSLLHEVTSFQRHLKQIATQNLSELQVIHDALPAASFQARNTLKKLHDDLSSIYNAKYALIDEQAISRIPIHWSSFLALPLDSQRKIAQRLPENSFPMHMMSALKLLRAAMERQSVLDGDVARGVAEVFDSVLADLKLRELEGDGSRGLVMKWRVFGVMALRRGEEGPERVERVLRKRVKVSGELVEFLEGLGELEG